MPKPTKRRLTEASKQTIKAHPACAEPWVNLPARSVGMGGRSSSVIDVVGIALRKEDRREGK